jgi:hypothetical protein
MPKSKLTRRLFTFGGVVGFALGLGLLLWGFWRSPQRTHSLTFSPEQLAAPVDGLASAGEARRMTLLAPAWMRTGDSYPAQLSFEPLIPAAAPQGSALLVESHLDFSALEVDPPEKASQALIPGRTATFWWRLRGMQPGEVEGTAWLALHFEPQSGTLEQEKALSAVRVNIRISSLGGLDGPAARTLGWLLAGIGLVLFGAGRFYYA